MKTLAGEIDQKKLFGKEEASIREPGREGELGRDVVAGEGEVRNYLEKRHDGKKVEGGRGWGLDAGRGEQARKIAGKGSVALRWVYQDSGGWRLDSTSKRGRGLK